MLMPPATRGHRPGALEHELPLHAGEVVVDEDFQEERGKSGDHGGHDEGDGVAHTKNRPIHPSARTFSHQCMTSTFASVRPLISVVTPLTSSWWAWCE